MTLRWRIALLLGLVAFGVGAFAAVASYLTTASQLRTEIDNSLKTTAVSVNGADGDGGRDGGGDGHGGHGPVATVGCAPAGSFQPAAAAQLVSDSGTVTACIDGAPTLPIDDQATSLAARSVELRTVSINGGSYRLLSTPWHDGGTLQIARELSESDALLGQLRMRLVVIVMAATALAAALGWAVATRLARPIVRLRDATSRIATTLDLSTPIEVSASGEVGSLAASFTAMVAALDRSQEQQRRLVSDASHEMRTPLTSLHSNVELIRQIERLPVGERQEVIDDVLEDVDELSTLLSELVELASDLAAAEPDEPVALGNLARTVALRTMRRSDRQVLVDDIAALEVIGRPRQLERAINNLVDNAVKYSPDGTPVEVHVSSGTVVVRDRGPGIPDEDLQRVFDRFYRAVGSRSEPGSGLGLAIVQEIVRSHGGQVFARNRDGGGAEVGFTLPTQG